MEDFLLYGFIIVVIASALVLNFILDVRKRREVVDLLPGEVGALRQLQDGSEWPEEMRDVKPLGEPIYSDGFLGHIRIHRNGVKARFATIDTITLLRRGTGLQRRHVVRYSTRFYPFEMIAAIYPIKIGMIRKGEGMRYESISYDGIKAMDGFFNTIWAAVDETDFSHSTDTFTKGPDVVTALQVETKDYRTALLCADLSGGECEVRAIVKALVGALGPRARQLVRLDMKLGGGYFIYEEPGSYDSDRWTRHPGEHTRIMLGDLHKHYALRVQPGYAARRKQANRVLQMGNIELLDQYLRTG